METRCLNGHIVTAGANFCPTCGAGVVAATPMDATMPIPVLAPPVAVPTLEPPLAPPPLNFENGAPPVPSQPSPPGGNRTPLIVAIVVVAAVIGGLGAFIATRDGSTTAATVSDSTAIPTTLPATTEAPTTAVPITEVPITAAPAPAAAPPAPAEDVRSLPAGLFCRDLNGRGFSYSAAVDYWRKNGNTDQMDADKNGIPCETVYPRGDVVAYWGAAAKSGSSAGSCPNESTLKAAIAADPANWNIGSGAGYDLSLIRCSGKWAVAKLQERSIPGADAGVAGLAIFSFGDGWQFTGSGDFYADAPCDGYGVPATDQTALRC